MKKSLVIAMLALMPLAGATTQVLAQKNVLSDGGGGAAFGKNALSGGDSALRQRNVLNPRGADMRAGNAIPDNRADMNAGNAIPNNRANMNAGNAIQERDSGLDAPNAIGRGENVIGSGESALRANNVIEQRNSGLEAENAMDAGNRLESGRSAFSTSSTRNALSDGNGVDARREVRDAQGVDARRDIGEREAVDSRRQVGEMEAVDARREAFRAQKIQDMSNAFGNEQGASGGGIGGALEVAMPGHGSATSTAGGAEGAGNANNVLAAGNSAFSEEFRTRLAERNQRQEGDEWWKAKNAFDGTITDTEAGSSGFGESAFR